jgi:hypothetical protein
MLSGRRSGRKTVDACLADVNACPDALETCRIKYVTTGQAGNRWPNSPASVTFVPPRFNDLRFVRPASRARPSSPTSVSLRSSDSRPTMPDRFRTPDP